MLGHCRREANRELKLRYTFTPMHGVGGEAVGKAFAAFGLPPFIPVVEQMTPDPEFPTVQFPNPEEGKSALVRPAFSHTHILHTLPLHTCTQDLAMHTAEEHGSTVILATDPDADRLALAEKNPSTGQWKIFSGNETGALLSWWALRNHRETQPHTDCTSPV